MQNLYSPTLFRLNLLVVPIFLGIDFNLCYFPLEQENELIQACKWLLAPISKFLTFWTCSHIPRSNLLWWLVPVLPLVIWLTCTVLETILYNELRRKSYETKYPKKKCGTKCIIIFRNDDNKKDKPWHVQYNKLMSGRRMQSYFSLDTSSMKMQDTNNCQ